MPREKGAARLNTWRLWSVRELFVLVERFRRDAPKDGDIGSLKARFRRAFMRTLQHMSELPDDARHAVDVLFVERGERLRIVESTDGTHMHALPEMAVFVDSEPPPQSGAASYCLWACLSTKRRVAVAVPQIADPTKTADIVLYQEEQDDWQRPGWTEKAVPAMYRPVTLVHGEDRQRYRSILCIPIALRFPEDDARTFEPVGVLSITCDRPRPIGAVEIEWAWTCSFFLAALLVEYRTCVQRFHGGMAPTTDDVIKVLQERNSSGVPMPPARTMAPPPAPPSGRHRRVEVVPNPRVRIGR